MRKRENKKRERDTEKEVDRPQGPEVLLPAGGRGPAHHPQHRVHGHRLERPAAQGRPDRQVGSSLRQDALLHQRRPLQVSLSFVDEDLLQAEGLGGGGNGASASGGERRES